ncbi:hypothetical protein [Bacillus sp. NPDC077027]|uniref:hypothetical protein n=1 Tax=Bacillus sp. NPDC077027 TaxID=3390548 RepID=UPI003CFF2DA0
MGIFLIIGRLYTQKKITLKTMIKSISFMVALALIFVVLLTNFHSVSLKNESIRHLSINQKLSNHQAFKKDDRFSHKNEVVFSLKGNDDDLFVTVDQNDQIKSISNHSKQANNQTSKGINIGDSVEDVVKTYGNQYKKLWFVEGYETGIQYQDKKNQLVLEFYFNDDQVYLIELRQR